MSTDGHIEPTTWGKIEPGHIVQDKNLKLWTVKSVKDRLYELDNGRTLASVWGLDDDPVNVYVPSEREAIHLLHKELGARILRGIEERERTIARVLTWRMDPVPRKAVALRDHIDWFHGVNVDDVLRKHNGTATRPAGKEQKKASLEELVQAHQEFHDDPGLWPHVKPHYHARIGDTS